MVMRVPRGARAFGGSRANTSRGTPSARVRIWGPAMHISLSVGVVRCPGIWMSLLVSICLLPALMMRAPAAGQEAIGFVIDIKGDWYVEGPPRKQVFGGSSLPSGGVILASQPYLHTSYIVIADRSGQVTAARRCEHPNECDQAIHLATADSGPSLAARFV